MKSVKLHAAYTICAALLVFLSLAVSGYTVTRASAEESSEYLRVINENTPFFSDKTTDTPLFYLPYTYYVRVLERGDVYTHVEYAVKGSAIDGYVPTEKLFDDGLTVSKPFPSVIVTTAETAVLYKDNALTSPLQYVFEGRSLYYYGKYVSLQGKTIYYVNYNDRLGYIKEESLVPFSIPTHPNELTFLSTNETEADAVATEETKANANESESTFNIRIAILIVLGLAGIIALVVALGKRPKPSPAASYYDENDFE